jgi:uncharacterized protein (TIGR02646 family)
MRAIRKGKEPVSLEQYRAKRSREFEALYNDFDRKDDIRRSLVAEQGGICCYCMQRIQATEVGMKIEHWRCQARFPAEQLDYPNMLGACLGGKGERQHLEHCDTSKKDKDLSKNPANAVHRIEKYIRFLPNGKIESTDPTLNQELNEVLNLNRELLRLNREAVLDAMRTVLMSKTHSFNKAMCERLIAEWNGGDSGGKLRPYCQVVVCYLRKKLRSLK